MEHDDLWVAIGQLRNQLDALDARLRRAEDTARDAQYTADDAKRAADDARNSAQRGW